jgi:hypothetical protein
MKFVFGSAKCHFHATCTICDLDIEEESCSHLSLGPHVFRPPPPVHRLCVSFSPHAHFPCAICPAWRLRHPTWLAPPQPTSVPFSAVTPQQPSLRFPLSAFFAKAAVPSVLLAYLRCDSLYIFTRKTLPCRIQLSRSYSSYNVPSNLLHIRGGIKLMTTGWYSCMSCGIKPWTTRSLLVTK